MWFRNLRIYTLADDFQLPEDLAPALTEHQFKPCGRSELASFGWSSPFGPRSEELFHQIGQQYLFCARKEEKYCQRVSSMLSWKNKLKLLRPTRDDAWLAKKNNP